SDHRLTYRLIWKYSSSAHERVLRFRVDGAGRPHGWSVALFGCFPNPGGEGVCPDGTFDSKGPGERPPLESELQAPFGGVQVRSASRSSSVGVRLSGPSRCVPSRDDSHQSGLLRTLPT